MPLDKREIPINFGQGLDTKTDPKQVLPGKFLDVQNSLFSSPGRAQKCLGRRALSQDVAGAALPISSGRAICTYDDELLLFDGSRAYSYDDAAEQWHDRGLALSVSVTSTPVIQACDWLDL
jgi:hypothetical protein